MNVIQQMRYERRMKAAVSIARFLLSLVGAAAAVAVIGGLMWAGCAVDDICSAANGL